MFWSGTERHVLSGFQSIYCDITFVLMSTKAIVISLTVPPVLFMSSSTSSYPKPEELAPTRSLVVLFILDGVAAAVELIDRDVRSVLVPDERASSGRQVGHH